MNYAPKGLNIDDTSVRIFDMMGCSIVERRITESVTAMDISALSQGTYVMEIIQGQQRVVITPIVVVK